MEQKNIDALKIKIIQQICLLEDEQVLRQIEQLLQDLKQNRRGKL
jgi:hypothetical protein